jgi:hypothetical protein
MKVLDVFQSSCGMIPDVRLGAIHPRAKRLCDLIIQGQLRKPAC